MLAPQIPENVFSTNSTCLTLNISKSEEECDLYGIHIEYKLFKEIHWNILASDIDTSLYPDGNISFCEFSSATWYQVKLVITNDAGKTTKILSFATKSIHGESVPQQPEMTENILDEANDYNEPVNWIKITLILISILLPLITL